MSKLGDFVKIQGGYSFKSSAFSDENIGIPVIKIANITGGSFIDLSKYQTVSSELLKKANTFKTEADDILIAMTGANVGKIARVPKDSPVCLINQRVGRVLLKENCQYSSDFIYYLLASNKSYEYFSKVATGAAQPNISGGLIEDLDFPEIDVERANNVGKILKTLDDKIQLNTQTNQTLEQIAQSIYKSWFVDYEPTRAKAAVLAAGGSMADAENAAMTAISGKNAADLAALKQDQPTRYQQLADLAAAFPATLVPTDDFGEIPTGWEGKPLDEIAHYQNGLALQKFRPENDSEYLPVVKIAQLRQGYADGNEKASVNINPNCIIDNGDVVFSWSGTLMVDIWCGGLAALNQHLFKVTSKHYPKWFYFLYTKHHLEEFQRIASGKAVTMGHIKREHLSQALCAVPDIDFLNTKCRIIEQLLDKIIANRLENTNIATIRDALLPKLLSGELQDT